MALWNWVAAISPSLVFELVVMIVILVELSALNHHRRALQRHERRLEDVMPLYPILYSENQKILDLALSFTTDARDIRAIGWLSSLTSQAQRPGEDPETFERRNARAKSFVKATEDHILAGRDYCRVMDWMPTDEASWREAKANAEFFLHLFQMGHVRELRLRLFHHPQIVGSSGDHHFRCSDSMVVLRIGGHGNDSANAAITITDARVVALYQRYYGSLIDGPFAKELTESHLQKLVVAFGKRDRSAAARILRAEAYETH